MRDTCTITVPSVVAGTVDPVTGLESETAGTVLYSGVCRLRMGGTVSGSATVNVAGDRVSVSTPTLSVPVGAARVPIGAIAVITGVPADDPAGGLRLGLRVRVTGLVLNTDSSAQRVTVEAVTG